MAVSWTLDYTVSLYNQVTAERIIKNSKRTFMDPKRWGRSLERINLGTSPIIDEIYNKIENPVYQVNVSEVRGLNRVKTVLSFVDSFNIHVETKTDFGEDFDGKTRWGQRELNLPLTLSDNYYNFKLFNRSEDSGFSSLNLNSTGVVVMRLVISNDEFIDITAEPDSLLDRGEVTFRITQLTAQKALNSNNTYFFIVLKSDDQESVIYEGKILNSFNETENQITNLNINLKREISELQNSIADLNLENSTKDNRILDNENKIIYLRDINNLYLRKIELLENNLDTTQIDSIIQNRLRSDITFNENTDLSKEDFSDAVIAPDKVTLLNSSLGTYKNI